MSSRWPDTYAATGARSLINRMVALDLRFTLADNDLPKVTRTCDIAGVDVAFPLLHESVVDLSARLHDIGKCAISNEVLRKPLHRREIADSLARAFSGER